MAQGSGWQGPSLWLSVRLQPRASRARVLGMQGPAIRIAVTAPPVEGAANQALCRWLAGELGVANGRVCIDQGEHARNKRVRIEGVERESARAFFQKWAIPEPD